jgi:hypothetical protein
MCRGAIVDGQKVGALPVKSGAFGRRGPCKSRHVFAESGMARALIGMIAWATVLDLSGCAPRQPTSAVLEPSPELLIFPGRGREQFASAVHTLKEEVERTRAISAMEYAGIRSSLDRLADAVQLLPRGAEALATIDAANVIRDAAVRVASPVLDDPSRTIATKQGLRTAAQTFKSVARRAYPGTPALLQRVGALDDAVGSIDESRVLVLERTKVLRAFDEAIAILEEMNQVTQPDEQRDAGVHRESRR